MSLLHYVGFCVELHQILKRDTHSVPTLKIVKSYFRLSMNDGRLNSINILSIET